MEGVENRVSGDGVRAILQYRLSDLYLTERKETMVILQKDTHTPLTFANKAFRRSSFSLLLLAMCPCVATDPK